MSEIIKYRLDLPIKISCNKIYEGMHWTKRKAQKDVYKREFLQYKDAIKKPEKFPVNIYFVFYYRVHALDSSNNSYMVKMIEDCLVEYGILPSDTIKHVSWINMKSEKYETDDKEFLPFVEFWFD